MKIDMGNSILELSYVELLVVLQKDVSSDEGMPTDTKEKALKKINELESMLWNYSA